MKFGLILSKSKIVLETMRIPSDRFDIFLEITEDRMKISSAEINKLILFDLSLMKAENKIRSMLVERKKIPSDIPDYKGRFNEDEVFVIKEIFGEKLKLCTSGFDSKIIFLSNIIDKKNEVLCLCRVNNLSEIYKLK